MILQGEGVLEGGTACTRQPTIIVDTHNRYILCDCPGFKDTACPQQEIINAFIIDYLFKCDPNTENKFKVLLVTSIGEFESSRGQVITESLERISSMLLCNRNLESGVGLVISKSAIKLTNDRFVQIIRQYSEKIE